jgi:hypothetical protein
MKIINGSAFSGMSGSFGEYVICQTADGPILKRKAKFSKTKWANDPGLQRIRNNAAEFGNAGKAVKLVRGAFGRRLAGAKDAKLTPRMQTVMMQVVKSDTVNRHGLRNAATGDLNLLKNFECNAHAKLGQILPLDYTIQINRRLGNVKLNLPAFIPKTHLKQPANATQFRIFCAVSEIDFTNGEFSTKESDSGLLPINKKATDPLVLNIPIEPDSKLPVFVALGIQFVEKMNGDDYPIESREFNPLCFVKIEKP